jgi:hypothetical protein
VKLTDEQLKALGATEEQIKKHREDELIMDRLRMQQCDALIDAGWRFEIPRATYLETWQWAWRRPPRRKASKGMRFASTQQAYNHLRKLKPKLPEICA